MENLLFVPSTRLLDRIEYGDEIFNQYIANDFGEVELTARGQDLVMSGQCTWKEFTEALGRKIVWISENAYLADVYRLGGFGGIINYGRILSVKADFEIGYHIQFDVWAASTLQASTACHILYRLLTTSGASMVVSEGTYHPGSVRPDCPFSGIALSQLIEQCPSLTRFYLKDFTLDEEILRALWAGAGTNIEIALENCATNMSGTAALVESLRRNLGPTRILWCNLPIEALADGLRGNDNVKILKLIRRQPITEDDMRYLVQSLTQNQGLEDLVFGQHAFSDENWSELCQSIARHPTLECMDVSSQIQMFPGGNERVFPLSATQQTRRAEMLLEMLKVNTVLHDIRMSTQDCNQQILYIEIYPRLVINRYRPRVRAIRTTQDHPLRAKLLGRALYSVNGNPSVIWLFLSNHKEYLLRGIQE
jgi:hypothetical protein